MTFLIERRVDEDSLWKEYAYVDIAPSMVRRFVEVVDGVRFPALVRYRRVEFVPPDSTVTTLGEIVRQNSQPCRREPDSSNWNLDV